VESQPREIEVYRTPDTDRIPFEDWLRGIKDKTARSRILVRLDRAENGNLGDHRSVGEGVWEMRIPYGPGYRVYYGEDGNKLIVLTGGMKDTQVDDINRAKQFWRAYRA
jgi:putative addiction module killer protein